MINEGYLDEISSPFDKDSKCDKYESFIDSSDGVIQLNDYIEEKQFLNDYRENTGYDIDRIVEIKPEHNILKKTYYRTIKEVE